MRKIRTNYLSEFITKQYPVEKYKELIIITLDIVENFLLTLEEGFDYNSTSVCKYECKYRATKNTSSKIESILINNYTSEEQMKSFLESYFSAYETLNDEEKKIFNSTFFEKISDLEIMEKYKTNSKHISVVRKSSIIRFCLKMGLDQFVSLI